MLAMTASIQMYYVTLDNVQQPVVLCAL